MNEDIQAKSLDWDSFEPVGVDTAAQYKDIRKFFLRPWFVFFVTLVICGCFGYGDYARVKAEGHQVAIEALANFRAGLLDEEKAYAGSSEKDAYLEYINGLSGFNIVEKKVREVDFSLAGELGSAWTDIQRKGLKNELDLVKLREMKSSVGTAHRILSERRSNLESLGLGLHLIGFGAAFFGLVLSL